MSRPNLPCQTLCLQGRCVRQPGRKTAPAGSLYHSFTTLLQLITFFRPCAEVPCRDSKCGQQLWVLCTSSHPAAARQVNVPAATGLAPACSQGNSAAADSGQALIGPACTMQAVQRQAAGAHTLPHQSLLL